ncbi:sulfatase-like hydrolase/transferase [Verrucomicrobiaceae bacterium 5K15]|uniref:Sulfatase-like hydrolase/transferase n=1 Tax=Oceaniferula flava TaxID=2800421 RepID=A0AAE2SAX0_9BACT|nr:sulfatase-like hydrolase/transferase [Oceaniferula flavus]MBK1853524.1 sulfatase-like hydrolase/transferase [Oceaniferula flavus]MBM1134829.1 sulfatase-like hydrolase/transferase [Oceaniferula flavus]
MKRILTLAMSSWLAISSAQAAEKPNILFIFADDMAVNTIRSLGNTEVKTPNLDRLVNGGTVFTHAYNSGAWHGAVCVASRTMLQTGLQVWDAKNTESKLDTEFLQKKRFWPQLLEKQGYETWFAGKWHVGSSSGKDKLAKGAFNHTANIRAGMPRPKGKSGYNRPKSKDDHGWKPWDKSNEGFWRGGKHWSEVLADDGEEFIAQAAKSDKPFFMMLAFNAPHDPRQAPKEYCDMYPYDKIQVPENFLPEYPHEICSNRNLRDERLAPFPRTPYAIQVHRSEYYALISHMDAQIGRILDALIKSGKADNTYIIFTADHGLACGEHGLMGKQNMFDHSVRVPWVIVGPDIPKAKKISSPIYLQDVMATTLEIGGAEKPGHVRFESVLPHIKGEGKVRETIYGAYMDKQRMVTTQKHKLIRYPQIDVELLFDLEKDPHEISDVSKDPAYAAVLKDMQKRLAEQMKDLGDPLAKN